MSEHNNDYFDPDGDNVINREEIKHIISNNVRSFSRRVALQVLYEVDSSGHGVGTVITEHLARDREVERVTKFMRHIVMGVIQHRTAIDTLIQIYAPEWPVDQVAVVDRNVLRIAVFELAIDGTPPIGVVIDEAVELAKLFGAENAPRFVNGVLGAIATNIEAVRDTMMDLSPATDENSEDENPI